jgi:hypothetical protein
MSVVIRKNPATLAYIDALERLAAVWALKASGNPKMTLDILSYRVEQVKYAKAEYLKEKP